MAILFLIVIGVPLFMGAVSLAGIHAALARIADLNERFVLNQDVDKASPNPPREPLL